MLQLVVDDLLAGQVSVAGVEVTGFDDWRASLFPVEDNGEGAALSLADSDVLGLLLSTSAAEAVGADAALSGLLAAAQVPVRDLGPSPASEAVLAAALGLLADRYAETQRTAAGDQRILAQLRRQHMEVQDDYAELESWVWDNLAPKHFTVRSWPPTAEVLALGPGTATIRQLLPAPVRGFIGVDLHLAESAPAGTLTMRCVRPSGVYFEGLEAARDIAEGHTGWIHVQLPRAGGGAPQDVEVELSFAPASGDSALSLSLAPESPFQDYCVNVGDTVLRHPLALCVHRTLPRMPAPPMHDNRLGLPADGITRLARPNDLNRAKQLRYYANRIKRAVRGYKDNPVVEPQPWRNAVLVQPSVHRPVGAKIEGVKVAELRQVRAIVQNSRHDTMEIAFALGVAPSGLVNSVEEALLHIGPWVHLLPAEWGEVWRDIESPLSGTVDLLLVTAMPNMPFNRNAEALYHGFRLTGGAWDGPVAIRRDA